MPAQRKPAATVSRVVPRNDAQKTGCAWCPLAPFCEDFAATFPAATYQRNAEALRAKSKDEHSIKSRLVEEHPWDKVDILFVGEAPGYDEDRQGKPFVGKSGKLLAESMMAGLGQTDYSVGITNVVRCRPPRNRPPNKTEMMSCGSRLVDEIKARQPRLIVALGNTPLEFLTGDSGILALAGKVLKTRRTDIEPHDVLACFHPAYVLRADNERGKFDNIIASCAAILEGTQVGLRGLGTYYVVDDVAQLRAFRDRVMAEKETNALAVDTETGSLDFWRTTHPGLLCISFSNGHEEGYTVPFDHRDSPFRVGGEREDQRAEIIELIIELLTAPGVARVGQNEKFDRKHLRSGTGTEPAPFDRDTFLTHVAQDERQGTHGLKTLAYQHTSCGGYERELDEYKKAHPECDPEKGGSFANFPGSILFRYAGIDADITWHVDNCLRSEPDYASNPRLQVYAETFLPILSRCLADMEYQGVQVDVEAVESLDRMWRAKVEEAAKKVHADPMVLQYIADNKARLQSEAEANPRRARGLLKKASEFDFNPGSPPQLRTILFDYYKLRPTELTDTGLDILKQRHERAGGRRACDFQDIIDAAIAAKEWSFFTTDAEAMQEFDRFGNPLASAITAHRAESKLHSAFIVPLRDYLDGEKRVHATFNIGGTQTGRLSSQDPNVQQIPASKGGGILKTPFVSRFGNEGVILNIDYSQIELRVAASLYRDESMIQAYRDGLDLHTLTAQDIVGKMGLKYDELDDAEKKKWRTGAKRTNFGIIYGAQAPTIQATCKKDGVFLTDEESETIVRVFLEARPGLTAGMDSAKEFLMKHGYIDAPTGTRRRIPEALSVNKQLRERACRQGVNFGVQCAAAQMTLMSLCLIWNRMAEAETRSKLVLNVHDSLVFDCHVDEVLQVAVTAKYIMEHLPEFSDEVWPGLEWGWLDVPIVAECEVGMNYGRVVGFDPDNLNGVGKGELIGLDKKGRETLLRDPANIDELWDAMAFKASH